MAITILQTLNEIKQFRLLRMLVNAFVHGKKKKLIQNKAVLFRCPRKHSLLPGSNPLNTDEIKKMDSLNI